MKKEKSQSFSKFGFIISAFGSSIGLGSIWRFPTIMAQSGGGAFLIPFVISMVICGIPILMFELNVGNKFRRVQVDIFDRLYGKKGRFFGYFYPTLSFLVAAFYVIIIGWVLIQIVISFSNSLLFSSILNFPSKLSTGSDFGTPNLWVVLALVFILSFVIFVSLMGLRKGIEKLNKILIPLLFIILMTLMFYCMTLDGASIGLNKMWEPDWSQLKETKVWTNAFSQSFFSLSIAMGTMMYFSSRTKKAQDNNNSAFVVALPLVLISIMAGMMNFSALGFLAKNSNQTIDEIIKLNPGPSLIFETFPEIFKQIGVQTHIVFGQLLSVLFYLALFSAGTMTLIALVEVTNGNILAKTKLNRKANTLIWVALLFFAAFVYTFRGGSYLIDGVDIWVNNIWLFAMAITEICLILLTIKHWRVKINPEWTAILAVSNQNSWIKIGRKYTILLLTGAFILFVMVFFKFYEFFSTVINNPENTLIPYVYFGLPMGLGLQIIIPTILTFKDNIKRIFLRQKKPKEIFNEKKAEI